MILKDIQLQLHGVVTDLFPEEQEINLTCVEYSQTAQFGDFSSNIALLLGQKYQQSPHHIAKSIIEKLSQSIPTGPIDSITCDGPGFLNFKIKSTDIWNEALTYCLPLQKHPSNPGQQRKIMVEFSSPNIAKPFNVGHLRSTIIGDSIARMYQYLGYSVLRDNHLGDWGTQYGKLAVAVEKWGDWPTIEANPITELFDLYVRFHRQEVDQPELAEEGRAYFKRLEQGDGPAHKVWQRLVDLSLQDFNQLYQLLNVHFDMMLGESFFAPMSWEIIQECIDKGVAQESQGALLIFYPNDELPPLMIRKSDGTSLYATRDLAAIKYRFAKYHLNKLIYEVGNEQELAFRQLIKAAEMLGYVAPGQLVHVGHGLFMLPTGKMSTRKGQTIWIRDLIQELQDKAFQVVSDKSPDMQDAIKQQVAQTVAMGALKYNDLSHNRMSNIVFEKEKSLSLEGNSAPYLQYTIARCTSILEKASNLSLTDNSELLKRAHSRSQPFTVLERALLLSIIRYNDTVEQAAQEYLPSHIASYLFNLAQKFSSFYQSESVLQATDQTQASRLLMVQMTKNVLSSGLQLLGIAAPDRM